MFKPLVILLLATVALTLIAPAVSGISLLKQAKGDTSGQNGKDGFKTQGGKGGSGNVKNQGSSLNGNGGDGGQCIEAPDCAAGGGGGGNDNSHNNAVIPPEACALGQGPCSL